MSGLVLGCLLLALTSAGVAQEGSAGPQRVLDILAAPMPADSDMKVPGTWAAFSEEQKSTVPKQLAARCGALWVMMNAGGQIALLPAAQDPKDTTKLVTDVCVTGKMPRDWPGRAERLAEAGRILQRSSELGAQLSVPVSLK